jgi:hypothetical protein
MVGEGTDIVVWDQLGGRTRSSCWMEQSGCAKPFQHCTKVGRRNVSRGFRIWGRKNQQQFYKHPQCREQVDLPPFVVSWLFQVAELQLLFRIMEAKFSCRIRSCWLFLCSPIDSLQIFTSHLLTKVIRNSSNLQFHLSGLLIRCFNRKWNDVTGNWWCQRSWQYSWGHGSLAVRELCWTCWWSNCISLTRMCLWDITYLGSTLIFFSIGCRFYLSQPCLLSLSMNREQN